MAVGIGHFIILGLPSDLEGASISEKEFSKAYRLKTLELHPYKRPYDPNAHIKLQKLKTSYEVLKDEKARKFFDDLLRDRVKHDKFQRESRQNFKRRKLMSDPEQRERAEFDADPDTKAREEEEKSLGS
jgi:DnaJ homolog subfamily C member 17